MVTLHKKSGCKVNLLLNILGRRPDGMHALETVMQPVPLTDELTFERVSVGIHLTCTHPDLPVDGGNLVYRAAERFLGAAGVADGVRIHLDKRLPLAAGIGAGSANAAVTLLALNELFGGPLPSADLVRLAAALGSDVPFFLQNGPAIATGRGEHVVTLAPSRALVGAGLVLIRPGFGVSTPWAYQALAGFPEALQGRPGRAAELVHVLQGEDLGAVARCLYNSLEAPVLRKYPLLAEFQEFLREAGAVGALMSGSGSTTFALTRDRSAGERILELFRSKFGADGWTAVVAL
ncbi:MAG: 4-(cytidine 5'-diphospho)-2-C-methyl-D-erythritol kinase [Verrucomicrobiales bacterium]|nr:4-(cytidine 5'-diphospho)-2-C-methyl-D-erythritol kinase [Verrucomicrobiales bacterium]